MDIKATLRNPIAKNWLHIFSLVLNLPILFISLLTPRKKNRWVFANRYGFKDNPAYLYDYVVQNHPHIDAIWISKSRHNAQQHRKNNINAYYVYSFQGIALQLTAKLIILCTGFADTYKYANGRAYIVQLWHGTPLKKILLDAESENNIGNSKYANILFHHILKLSLQRIDLIIAPTEDIKTRLMSAFGATKEKVKVTGYPRIDHLLSAPQESTSITRLLYAPTWRKNNPELINLINTLNNKTFDEALHSLNAKLIIKLHPLTNYSGASGHKNISIDFDCDINNLLPNTDILITDYSSVFYDFSIFNRPIIFYTTDLEQYTKERGFYDNYNSLAANNLVHNSEQILIKISKNDLNTYFKPTQFNTNLDTNNCKRVYKEISGLLK